MRIFDLIIRTVPIGWCEQPQIDWLALATMLAHLAIAIPVQAQVLAAAPADDARDDHSVYSTSKVKGFAIAVSDDRVWSRTISARRGATAPG